MKRKIAIGSIVVALAVILVGVSLRIFILPKIFDRGQKHQNINYPKLNYEPEVSEKLKKMGIPHKIDKEGTLMYSRFNEKYIDLTYSEVDRRYFPEWNNFSFRIDELQSQFKKLLVENEVPFIVRKLDAEGHEYVLWDPLYNDRAEEVKKSLLENMNK